jgi:16S rRNA (adenine1518-N6/adenine1519-N6)-dimethyltransferase
MTHIHRKRFGQHFLHDPGIICKIVEAINGDAEQHLVEIGPGAGAITAPLLAACYRLDVVELDRDLIAPLQHQFGTGNKLRIHNQDALQTNFCALQECGEKLRIVGNLPYNISTPLLFHILDQVSCIKDMHFMLQKEVAERLAAPPGSGVYGRLSVMLQYRCAVQVLFLIGPGAFKPPPKVDSAFIRLIPHTTPPVTVQDEYAFDCIVRQAFAQRRKTLRNALRGLLDADEIYDAGVDPGLRAERLGLSDFAALSSSLSRRHS